MASVISSRKEGDSVIMEIKSDYEEFLQLRGYLDNIHFFTSNISEIKSNISQRGRNEATKYFLIPRQFRRGFKFNNTTSCQRLDFDDKVIFVYFNLLPGGSSIEKKINMLADLLSELSSF